MDCVCSYLKFINGLVLAKICVSYFCKTSSTDCKCTSKTISFQLFCLGLLYRLVAKCPDMSPTPNHCWLVLLSAFGLLYCVKLVMDLTFSRPFALKANTFAELSCLQLWLGCRKRELPRCSVVDRYMHLIIWNFASTVGRGGWGGVVNHIYEYE
jgi:hypothetical protein